MKNTAYIVVGLGYGDEGKGSIVDFLTEKYKIDQVVRFSGGSQAAHHVVNRGRTHKFSQICSGAYNGATSYISKDMLLDPILLLDEIDEIGINPKIYIDENAIVITPIHSLLNRYREWNRGNDKHGSCGMGVGEARSDYFNGHYITVNDLLTDTYLGKLYELAAFKKSTYEFHVSDFEAEYVEMINEFIGILNIGTFDTNKSVVFEGSQGVLLDEIYGFAPYYTWTDVTHNKALTQLKDFDGNIVKLGLTRAYMSRHGVGPFPTEDQTLTYEELHNKTNKWQDEFRYGHLDLVMLRYSIDACGGIDGLVVSHLDQIPDTVKVCVGYKNIDPKYYVNGKLIWEDPTTELTKQLFNVIPIYEEVNKDNLIEKLEKDLGVKVVIESYGETYADKVTKLT